jgi:amino acid transporter
VAENLGYSDADRSADTRSLQEMGYAQELPRRMGAFQNFAISFAIICIVAGGITAFPAALSAAGGAGIGIMWPVGALFAILVAAALGQIASSYPTAGGIYHWSSTLGGRGFGWSSAWFNLLGLVFVVASVNWGLYNLFRDLFLGQVLGMDVTNWVPTGDFSTGWWYQTAFIAGVTVVQAIINHYFLRLTTTLTDFSGYLILATAVLLTVSVLAFAPSLNINRLFTFSNFTGAAGGNVWPEISSGFWLLVMAVSLLHVVYTITGFDASAHTSEETRNAPREVPKGMIRSVFWSFLVGYVMVCSFVLAFPDQKDAAGKVVDGVTFAAGKGWSSFNWLLESSAMPFALKALLIVGIVVSNFLCALAGITSTSRMMYAFARDGGLPASGMLKRVSPTLQTPGSAIWVGAILAVAATLYGNAFLVLSTGCAVFLYISYLMPIAAAMWSEMNGGWKNKGPFSLGALSIPIAVLAIIGCAILIFVGVQPPQEKVLYITIIALLALGAFWGAMEGVGLVSWVLALLVLLALYWFMAGFSFTGGKALLGLDREGGITLGVATFGLILLMGVLGGRRFAGPPVGDDVARRQAEITRS